MAGGGSVELGTGYISVVPSAKGFQKDLDRQIGQATSGASKAGEDIGKRMSSGMTKALKVGAAAAGAAAVAGIGLAVKGGLESALNVDAATRSLTGLHGSAEKAADTIARVGKVSRDSSIDHADYAEAAKNLAYIGVEGDQLESILTNAGDAIVGFGGDGSNLERVNDSLSKMVNNGKVNREELLQLSDAGIPIFEGLSTHLGVTVEEMNKMVSDGVVGIEDVLSVMENGTGAYFGQLLDAGGEMEKGLGATWSRLKDNLKLDIGEAITNSGILDAMVPMMSSLGDVLLGAVDSAVAFAGAMQDVGGWIRDNHAWIGPLAAAIGGAALAWGAWVGAIKLWQRATKIAAGIQVAFNAVMAANPIMLIVIAIAALVAGLIYFFTQTETGKAVWDSLVQAFATGWEWVQNAFTVAWGFIQPVLSGIWNAIKLVGAIFATVLLGSALVAWNLFSAAIQYVWNAIIKPVWDAFAAVMTWLWNVVVMPIWNAMKVGLQLLGVAFQWVWNSVIKPAWDALGAGIAWVWNTIIRPAWDALKIALGAVGTFFQWVWNSIIKPAWDALGAGIRWVADTIIHPVFDGIQRGLDLVRSAFRVAVDVIGAVWNEMREKTAAPIRFVIDTVYNKGIVAVWNKVAGWLGMDDKKLEPMTMAFKSGGVLPGYTPGKDVHKFVNPSTGQGLHLSGGEAIMRPEWTRAVGGASAVDRMNRDARNGRVRRHGRDSAAFADGGVLAFANGGVIGAMMNIVQQKYPGITMTDSIRPGANDMHGQGLATDWSNGGGNTPMQLALAHDIASTYPGSAELIYDSPGWSGNIKNGANVGAFGQYYTMGQAGPHHHHVHWAMTTPPTMPFGGGVFEGGSDGGGGGGISIVGSMVRKAMDTIMNPIMDSIPDGQGLIGGMGRGLGDKVYGTFKDWVLSKLPSGGGSSANGDWVGNPGVEQFRGLVEKLLKEKGQPLSLTGSVLRRMNQESSGNPNAINLTDSNAMAGIPSKGLMQTIDPTFQAHKDPGYDDIWDPESNIRASMNYALAQYGGLAAAYDRAGGYDSGGVLQPGTTLAINETGKPEAILTNPQWQMITNLVIATAELLDPLRMFVRDGRDMARHLEEIADNSRRQVAAGFDAAGLAVWEALPSEMQDAISAANTAGRMWDEISHRIADKAVAWSKGEWPIGSARTPVVEPGPGWQQFRLDDSLQSVARANLDLADAVIAGDLSPGNDPVANAIYDVFGRDPILPDLARIAAGGDNAIVAATEAAWHAFETGETSRLEEWTDSNSQLTEAVLRTRDAAIHTGKMVQGAVNGYLNWAMASDSQGRQGSWQEYFQHYGGEYGTAEGDWLLGQVGLGGILGGKFKDSFANLLIETAQSPFLAAPEILDDDGRVIGTQLKSQEQAQAVPAASAETLTPESVGDTAGNVVEVSVSLPEGKSAFTAEEVEEMLGKIDEDVDEIRVKVDRLGKPASVTSGVSMMV